MKVLVLDTVHSILHERLSRLGYELREEYQRSPEQLQPELEQYTGLIVRSRFPLNEDFLKHAPNLKFIGRVGAGLENIDMKYAESAGIRVLAAPEGNRDAVGEHALGMLLMLFNNLKRADAEVRAGIWRREENRGYELKGKTVGIIGYGNMGSAFAEKLAGFGCKVLAYDKYKSGFGNRRVKEVSLQKLQAQAEVVSLHVPQTAATLGLINRNYIRSFKKPFYLINTARGKSLVTEDLVAAMREGKILGACLDVLEYEKSSFENMFTQALPSAFEYLINSERVVLSPHIAGWTHESNARMAEVIATKIVNL